MTKRVSLLLLLSSSLCLAQPFYPNSFDTTNDQQTFIKNVLVTNNYKLFFTNSGLFYGQLNMGSNGAAFVFRDDDIRLPNLPVAVLQPTIPTSSMILDVVPSGDNTITNADSPFFSAIDLVNRNLSAVSDKTNYYVNRMSLKTNVAMVGGSAGGTNDAPMLIMQAGTNNTRPFSWVLQGTGGSSSTTNMYVSSDGALNVTGTTLGNPATAGWVGEYLAVTNNFATGTNCTSNLDTNALKLALTAGDWSVVGHATFASSSSSAKATQLKASIGLVNNTVNSDGTQVYNWPNVTNNAFTASVSLSTPVRVNVTTSTTVYLNANATFSSGPVVVYGEMEATRIR